jgi:pyrroloquinoline-quinone synthase
MSFSSKTFWSEVESGLARHDLLCHPYYQAWSAGELSAADLRQYAAEYYQHVAAFPTYLSRLHARLVPGALRTAVATNLADEEYPVPHSEMWLDFLRGMAGSDSDVEQGASLPEMRALIAHFTGLAETGSVAGALAAFYAYESQVPRIAAEKARGLEQMYGAGKRTCRYFTLHEKADVQHAQVWREQLDTYLAAHPEEAATALAASEQTAEMLWKALDGVQHAREQRLAIQ